MIANMTKGSAIYTKENCEQADLKIIHLRFGTLPSHPTKIAGALFCVTAVGSKMKSKKETI